jgi:hypothetical protein
MCLVYSGRVNYILNKWYMISQPVSQAVIMNPLIPECVLLGGVKNARVLKSVIVEVGGC